MKRKCQYQFIEGHGIWESEGIGPHIIISVLEGGEYSVSRPDPSTPYENPPTSTRHEAGWFLQKVWTFRWSQKFLSCPRISPQLLAFPAISLTTTPTEQSVKICMEVRLSSYIYYRPEEEWRAVIHESLHDVFLVWNSCESPVAINRTAVRAVKLLQDVDSAVESLCAMVLPCLALS